MVWFLENVFAASIVPSFAKIQKIFKLGIITNFDEGRVFFEKKNAFILKGLFNKIGGRKL